MNLCQRSYQPELLDGDNIPFEDIRRNMQELDFINTYLGGHAITLKGLQQLIGHKTQVHICEIGCGGGDNLLAIQRWCASKNIQIRFTGIDLNPNCIEFAKSRTSLWDCTDWMISDYRDIVFDQKPDIIFSSLFCHHFTDEVLVQQLQWMKLHAATGFFINDLQRHPLAYYSIKILTRIFSRSYLVKHDAPLSVARGFSKAEWEYLFSTAGLQSFIIQWRWAFRYLIIFRTHER